MKVCIISPNFLEPKAWMVSAYKTALLLKRAGFDVVVLTSKTEGSLAYEEVESVKVFRMKCFFVPDPFNYTVTPGLFFRLLYLVHHEKPDVFIVSKYMFFTSLSVFLLKLLGKKVVLQTDTFPGIVWFAPSKVLNAFMWVYSRTIGRIILKLSDCVVLLHEGLIPTAKKLKLNYSVIHNGVDLKEYDDALPSQEVLALKKDKVLVTYVGRLDAVKGYDILLQVAKVLEWNKELHFLFVCGDKNPELRAKLQKEHGENVTFWGFRKDIPQILKATDIYVLPSHAEGLPNTLMEAMSAGCACIASEVGGVPYLLTDKVNGFLVQPGNSDELQLALVQLVYDAELRYFLGMGSHQTIKEGFSWDVISKQWEDLLEQQ